MTDVLVGMVQCYQQDIEKVLPEYPELVTDDEISYVNGVDDFGRFMIGSLDGPKYDIEVYMKGWKWAEDNWFGEFLPRTVLPTLRVLPDRSFTLMRWLSDAGIAS